MNVSIYLQLFQPRSVSPDELSCLNQERTEISYTRNYTSIGGCDHWNMEARNNYYYKLSRIVHFLACVQLSKFVSQKEYSLKALKNYFFYKINLQSELYRCRLDCSSSSILEYKEFAKRAKQILHSDESLTKRIVNYVNCEEEALFKKLPVWDQCKVLYAVYRDKLGYYLPYSAAIVKITAVGAALFMARQILSIEIARYFSACVSGCEPL